MENLDSRLNLKSNHESLFAARIILFIFLTFFHGELIKYKKIILT